MIWFRNIITYRLDAAELAADAINAALASKPFIAPGAQDLFSQGWVSPASHQPDLYAIESQGALLVQLRTDEKILPASVIRREADERAQQIETTEGRKIGRRELRELREAVAIELLPRALVKTTTQRAIIDLRNGFVFVESGSASKAENLLSVLRETLGSLPTRLLVTRVSPQTAMTAWLQDGAPEGFSLDLEAELKFPGAFGSVAKFTRQTLDAESVQQNLADGKLVTKLGMSFQDRVAFVLTDKLHLKRMTMLDLVEEEIESMGAQDQVALFDSTLVLCVAELRGMVAAVIEALGGEENVSA